MAISYNPSSFATNKTILEAIEELKKYLMENPLACIYRVSENADLQNSPATVSLTSIYNPNSQELKDGDILVSLDSYYGFITNVGETTVEIDNWNMMGVDLVSIDLTYNFESGYKTPTYFTGWIYRFYYTSATNYRANPKYTLALEYKDGASPNYPISDFLSCDFYLSFINAIWYHDESDGSKTIYVDGTQSDGTSYETNFNLPAGQDGAQGVSITGASIDGNNHLILTLSDGNTIDAGALPTPSEYTHTVSISSTSGTFSDSDFDLLGYGDSVIKYTDAYSITTAYKLKLETASILEFESIDASSRNNLKLIDVNKTTKAYSMTSVSMIKSSTFDSGTATSGKVLTANGSGGTSWESVSVPAPEGTSVKSTGETSGKVLTADGSGGASWQTAGGGGGSTLYQHNIFIYIIDSGSNQVRVRANFTIINTTATAYTVSSLNTYLDGKGDFVANGDIFYGGTNYRIKAVFYASAGLGVKYYTYLNTELTESNNRFNYYGLPNFTDNVQQIS